MREQFFSKSNLIERSPAPVPEREYLTRKVSRIGVGKKFLDWSKSEVNSIRIALSRGRHSLVERLSNRLGVDERSIRGKIREIELKEKIRKSARGAKERLKKHQGRRIRKYGGRIKERFQG